MLATALNVCMYVCMHQSMYMHEPTRGWGADVCRYVLLLRCVGLPESKYLFQYVLYLKYM